jgi:hypothetical protein
MKNLTIELSKIKDQGRSRWRAAMPDLEVDATGSTISQALEALVDAIVDESLNVALTAMQAPSSTAPVDRPNETMRRPAADEPQWTTNERLLGEDLRKPTPCNVVGPADVSGYAPLCAQRAGHAGYHVSWTGAVAWPQEPLSAPESPATASHEAEGSPAIVGRYDGSEGPQKAADVKLAAEPRWASTVYDSSEWGSGACPNCGHSIDRHDSRMPGWCPVPG